MASLRRACALALCAALLSCLCSAESVFRSPPQMEEFKDDIHPYAFAHQMSLPEYAVHQHAYAPLEEFHSFLELPGKLEVKALVKGSTEAEALPVIAMELQSTVQEQFFGDALKKVGGAIKNVLGIGGNKGGDPNDPAAEDPMPIKPNAGAFANDPRRHGTFPGNDNYRRAVYGLRRRRMPYTTSRTFGSMNPYRRPNDWHKNAMDYLFPRDRFILATHPDLTDFGKMGPSGVFPYGDYSSFTPSHSLMPGRWDMRLRGRGMLGDLGATVNLPFQPIPPHQAEQAYFGPGGPAQGPQTVVIVNGQGGPGMPPPPPGWGGGWGGFGGFGGFGGGGSKWDGQKFGMKGGMKGGMMGGPGGVKGGGPKGAAAGPAGDVKGATPAPQQQDAAGGAPPGGAPPAGAPPGGAPPAGAPPGGPAPQADAAPPAGFL